MRDDLGRLRRSSLSPAVKPRLQPNRTGVRKAEHSFTQPHRARIGDLRITVEDPAVTGSSRQGTAGGPEAAVVAEVVASEASLMGYGPNADAALGGGVWCSMALVAGAGFEPAAFRL